MCGECLGYVHIEDGGFLLAGGPASACIDSAGAEN